MHIAMSWGQFYKPDTLHIQFENVVSQYSNPTIDQNGKRANYLE